MNKELKIKVKIREAKKSDAKELRELIKELAVFEKLTPPDKAASKRLIKSAFSKRPDIRILVAEADNKLAGYAIYFFTYSSFLARKSLYLEDIFISENFRSIGIGKLFFVKLKKISKDNKCGRMEWVVLDWNEIAIRFYEHIGAKHLHDWKTYRLIL